MDPFLGEIKAVGFPWVPQGWLACQGQLMQISQYTALYSLLGTQFGGDGQTTFGLPDLRGRTAVGTGAGPGLQAYPMGQKAGVETVTLTTAQMPAHNHMVSVDASPGSTIVPQGNNLAQVENTGGDGPWNSFTTGNPATPATLNPNTINIQGASQAHENRPPYQVVNYIIAYQGVYPQRS